MDIDTIIAQLNSKDEGLRRESVRLLGERRDSRAVDILTDLIRDDDLAIRDAAVNALMDIGGEEAAGAVMPLLYDEDAAIRNMSIEILEGIGKEAVEKVSSLLNEDDEDVLKFAVDILGNIGNPDLAPLLTPLLGHKNPNVRSATAITLGKIKSSQAVKDIIPLLDDKDEWVRFSALEALGSLGTPDLVDRLLDVVKRDGISKIAALDALSNLAAPSDAKKVLSVVSSPEVSTVLPVETIVRFVEKYSCSIDESYSKAFLDTLVGRLSDMDLDERRNALRGIILLKDPSAIDGLMHFAVAVDEADEETSKLLREALVTVGTSGALIKRLKSNISSMSIFIDALGEMGDSSVVHDLKSLIDMVDRDTKKILLKSLEKIGKASSFDTISDALRDKDGHVRKIAAVSLGEIGERRAIPLLHEAILKEPFRDVQEAMADVLSDFKGEEVEEVFISLLGSEKPALRVIALHCLGRLQVERAREAVINSIYSDKDVKVREEAVRCLRNFTGEDTLKVLGDILNDREKDLRIAAIEVLDGRGDGDALLIGALGDSDIWVRFKVVNMLAERDTEGIEGRLIELLLGDEIPVKVAAARALGRVGTGKAVEALKRFEGHEDSYLSDAAIEAIKAIVSRDER